MIKPLTSLRFIFAFMVFMSHSIIFSEGDYPFLHHLFFEGYIGVSFFFVLSGFILAYNYQQKFADKLIPRKTFYVSRFARIYPLHIFTLLIWMWMRKDVPVDSTYLTNLSLNILLLQSFYPLEGIKFNAVSWSLSDEMFFYLLFPLLIVWFVKSRRSFYIFWTLAIIFIFYLISLYQGSKYENWIFYLNPLTRIVDFSLGIVLFNICTSTRANKWRKSLSPTLLEVFAIMLIIVFYSLAYFIPYVYRHASWYWLPVGFLICVFYFQAGAISRILSHRWLVLLGEISFSFYMFHTMVLWYVKRFSILLLNTEPPQYIIFIGGTIFAVIVSYFSYKFIETPSNRFIKRLFLTKSK